MENNELLIQTKCAVESLIFSRLWQDKERDINQEKDEAEIIRRLQAGDKDRYQELVESYKDPIFSLVHKQTGSALIAEEITQDVFIKAFFSITKFRSDSRFSTWLTRIALNQTSSYFSSKKFRIQKLTDSFDPIQHQISDNEKNFEIEQENRRSRQMKTFYSALANLKPTFRDAITICALNEKSYQEAAEILEIPIGTVRSRLNKARLLLSSAIKQLEA